MNLKEKIVKEYKKPYFGLAKKYGDMMAILFAFGVCIYGFDVVAFLMGFKTERMSLDVLMLILALVALIGFFGHIEWHYEQEKKD